MNELHSVCDRYALQCCQEQNCHIMFCWDNWTEQNVYSSDCLKICQRFFSCAATWKIVATFLLNAKPVINWQYFCVYTILWNKILYLKHETFSTQHVSLDWNFNELDIINRTTEAQWMDVCVLRYTFRIYCLLNCVDVCVFVCTASKL